MHEPRTWMVAVSAWPMCSTPVTFGGGSTVENLFLGFDVGGKYPATESGLKKPESCHHWYQPASRSGEYLAGKGSETSFFAVTVLNITCWGLLVTAHKCLGDNLRSDMFISKTESLCFIIR